VRKKKKYAKMTAMSAIFFFLIVFHAHCQFPAVQGCFALELSGANGAAQLSKGIESKTKFITELERVRLAAQNFSDLAWSLSNAVIVEFERSIFARQDIGGNDPVATIVCLRNQMTTHRHEVSLKNAYNLVIEQGFLKVLLPDEFLKSLTPFGTQVFHHLALEHLEKFAIQHIKFNVKGIAFSLGHYLLQYRNKRGDDVYCVAKSTPELLLGINAGTFSSIVRSLVIACTIQSVHHNPQAAEQPDIQAHVNANADARLLEFLYPFKGGVTFNVQDLKALLVTLNVIKYGEESIVHVLRDDSWVMRSIKSLCV